MKNIDRREFLKRIAGMGGLGLISHAMLSQNAYAWTMKRLRRSKFDIPLGTTIIDGAGMYYGYWDTRYGLSYPPTSSFRIGRNVKAITIKAWGGGGGNGGRFDVAVGGHGGAGGYVTTKLIVGTHIPVASVLYYTVGGGGGGGVQGYASGQGGGGTGVWIRTEYGPRQHSLILSAGGGGGGGGANWSGVVGGRGGGGGEAAAGAGGWGPSGAGGTLTNHGAGGIGTPGYCDPGWSNTGTWYSLDSFTPIQSLETSTVTIWVGPAGGGGGVFRGGPGYQIGNLNDYRSYGCGGGGGANVAVQGTSISAISSTTSVPANSAEAGTFGHGGSGQSGSAGLDGKPGRLIFITE